MLCNNLRLGGGEFSSARRAVKEGTVIGIRVEAVLDQESILYVPRDDGGTDMCSPSFLDLPHQIGEVIPRMTAQRPFRLLWFYQLVCVILLMRAALQR